MIVIDWIRDSFNTTITIIYVTLRTLSYTHNIIISLIILFTLRYINSIMFISSTFLSMLLTLLPTSIYTQLIWTRFDTVISPFNKLCRTFLITSKLIIHNLIVPTSRSVTNLINPLTLTTLLHTSLIYWISIQPTFFYFIL